MRPPWILVGASVAVAIGATGAACQPTLDDTVSIIATPTVLAVQSNPAEAPPTTKVTYTALVTAGVGPDAGVPRIAWGYCNARNPLTNLGPADIACVEPGNAEIQSLGVGLQVAGGVPALACGSFGPNAPPPVDGGPAGQPVDPDSTGGYYQPVSVFLEGSTSTEDTLYFQRISCGFSGANQAAAGALVARYHLNDNPEIASLSAGPTKFVSAASGATTSVAAGKKLELNVAWPVCPLVDRCGDGICGADESQGSCPADCANPNGCAGAERYVNLDPTTETLVVQREGIHVSWYATRGAFDQDRTGVAGTDDTTHVANGWTPPPQAGPVNLWVVLRDDRGGVGWEKYAVVVE